MALKRSSIDSLVRNDSDWSLGNAGRHVQLSADSLMNLPSSARCQSRYLMSDAGFKTLVKSCHLPPLWPLWRKNKVLPQQNNPVPVTTTQTDIHTLTDARRNTHIMSARTCTLKHSFTTHTHTHTHTPTHAHTHTHTHTHTHYHLCLCVCVCTDTTRRHEKRMVFVAAMALHAMYSV